MILIRSTSFSGSCIALLSGSYYGREEGGSFLIWYDLDLVVPWVVLFELLIAWVVGSNRSIPNCPFFRRLYVSVAFSFFNNN